MQVVRHEHEFMKQMCALNPALKNTRNDDLCDLFCLQEIAALPRFGADKIGASSARAMGQPGHVCLQGLKPRALLPVNVGAKAPTP